MCMRKLCKRCCHSILQFSKSFISELRCKDTDFFITTYAFEHKKCVKKCFKAHFCMFVTLFVSFKC